MIVAPRRAAALAVLASVVGVSATLAQPTAAPRVPEGFALAPAEQAYLDQVLLAWERESGKITTFACPFTRWAYDPVFGPGMETAARIERGELSYQRPDKGRFEINDVQTWDAAQQKHVPNDNVVGEKWVCDGKAVYEFKAEQKQVAVRPIPPEMQGESIVDGPLPFLFGAEAAKIKRRYWLRLDPRGGANGELWLKARPKFHQDAANYRQVELFLDRERLLPTAMRVEAPDGSQTVYAFAMNEVQINSTMARMWGQLFSSPRTPFGWTRVVVDGGTRGQAAQPGVTRK